MVIAPLLVGGKETPTLIDRESISISQEIGKLIECKELNNSYIQLRYKVIK